MNKKRAVISLSGGMDSTTVLAWMIANGYECDCVGFYYGSKHNQYENELARTISDNYDVPFQLIDISSVMKEFKSNLLMSGGDIPEGHYEEKSMSQTVVPGRNMIFISILAGYAWSKGAEAIGMGIHQGDHAIYADCRQEFFYAMNTACYLGSEGRVKLIAPFLETDKTGILEYGISKNVPYQLTRTCYKHQEISCGKCGSCQERLEAFKNIGHIDPIKYEGQ